MLFPGLAEAIIPQKIPSYTEKKHNVLLWRTHTTLLVWLLHKWLLHNNRKPHHVSWTDLDTKPNEKNGHYKNVMFTDHKVLTTPLQTPHLQFKNIYQSYMHFSYE